MHSIGKWRSLGLPAGKVLGQRPLERWKRPFADLNVVLFIIDHHAKKDETQVMRRKKSMDKDPDHAKKGCGKNCRILSSNANKNGLVFVIVKDETMMTK